MKQTIEEPILDTKLINWSYQVCYDYFLLRKAQEKENPAIIDNCEQNISLDVPHQSDKVIVKYSSIYTEVEYLKQNDLWFNTDLSSFWNSSASVIEPRAVKLAKLPRIREEEYEYNEPEDSSYTASSKVKYLQNIINLKQSYDNEELIIVKNPRCVNKVFKLSCSGIIGIGTGLAMIPIFNDTIWQLENFDIHIHEDALAFALSTANTLAVVSTYSASAMYKHLTLKDCDHLKNATWGDGATRTETTLKNTLYLMGKLTTICAALQPVIILWNVELLDRKFADSQGFDQFLAWATFATIPLMVFKSIENYECFVKTIENGKLSHIELDSLGAKMVTYGAALFGIFGRAIIFTYATSTMIKETGCDDGTATTAGLIIGGILANGVQGLIEYGHVQALFEKNLQPASFKNILKGFFASLEGGWFALPSIAIGLNVTNDYNLLLKIMIFLPTFFSRATLEANNIYNAFSSTQDRDINLNDTAFNFPEPVEHPFTSEVLLGQQVDYSLLD